MEKINFPKRFRVYLPLIALFLILVLLMPRSPKFTYEYKKGSPWMYETLTAQFDFPILKTEAQLLEDRENAGFAEIPYFKLDSKVESKSLAGVASLDFGEWYDAKVPVSEAVGRIYAKGILSPSVELGTLDPNSMIYIQKDRRAVKQPVSEVYSIESASAYVMAVLAENCADCNIDSLYKISGLASLIVPNLIYDQQTTNLIEEDNVLHVSTTQGIMRAGQVIVSDGEIVTAEIEQLLDSYKAEYDMSVGYDSSPVFMWLGNIVVAFCIVLVLFFALCFCNYKVFDEYNKYLYILFVFAIAAVASLVIAYKDASLFYLMPFTLISLYLLAFFTKKLVFSVYFISLLPMLIFAPDGVELFVMYLVAGSVGMLVFGRFNRGWLQFVTALIVFGVLAVVWTGFRLIDGVESLKRYWMVTNMFFGSLLSVAGYPLIYLFEKMFKLVSNSKLIDLSDTNNPLLLELADKAPGTFQHSLQVMNLSDAAARSINANVLLVRAGALYHDIGKIANPQCFTENETPGIRYHAELTPKESAQEIIKHVSDGLAMADKHGLPDVIKDFIVSHHGTTATGYFLTKYLNDGGEPDEVSEFYYNGKRPTTKEQVVLMVCDSVEAASRSLKDYSAESIAALVDNIVNGKSKDLQFDDADISLRELSTLKEVIKSYLQQMYHSRVSYPKRKEKAK